MGIPTDLYCNFKKSLTYFQIIITIIIYLICFISNLFLWKLFSKNNLFNFWLKCIFLSIFYFQSGVTHFGSNKWIQSSTFWKEVFFKTLFLNQLIQLFILGVDMVAVSAQCVGVGFPLKPCGAWGLNSGYQSWQEVDYLTHLTVPERWLLKVCVCVWGG